MAGRALAPIPASTPIADPKDGTITTFMRLRWQQLVDGWGQSATANTVSAINQSAALAATVILTPLQSGLYRVTWYLRRMVADPGGSSALLTLTWLDLDARPLTYPGLAWPSDAADAWVSETKLLRCLAASDLRVAVAYTSAAGLMRYDLQIVVEQVG
jgi:hypothetical protein